MTEYMKPIVVIFLIMVLSLVYLATAGEESEGITGMVVSELPVEEKPIQEVVKDLENQGFEYVANDPMRYTDE